MKSKFKCVLYECEKCECVWCVSVRKVADTINCSFHIVPNNKKKYNEGS